MLLYDINPKKEKFEIFAESDSYLEEIIEKIYITNPLTNQIQPLSNFSISKPLTKSKAIELSQNLTNHQIIKKNNNFHIIAYDTNENLKHLPNQFFQNANMSAKSALKFQLNFPFPKLKKQDNYLIQDNNLTLEEFTNLNTACFDTEFMFWEKSYDFENLELTNTQIENYLNTNLKNKTNKEALKILEDHFNKNLNTLYTPQPTTLQLAYEDKVYYFKHLSGKNKTHNLNLATGPTNIVELKSNNANEMVNNLQNIIKKEPFQILITQNGMNYDLLQLRKFQKDFQIKNQKPKITGQGGFFYKVLIPGIYHIDLAPYSQNYFNFTIDNKFETISSLILNKKITKKESYDDLTKSNIEQLLGNDATAQNYLEYSCEDVTTLLEIANYIKPIIYLKSNLFKKRPESIYTTSKKTLGLEKYNQAYLTKTFQPKLLKKEEQLNFNKQSSSELFHSHIDIKQKTKQGIFNTSLYYIAPLTNSYLKEIKSNTDIKQIFKFLNQTTINQQLAKYDLISTIEESFLYPYFFFEKNKPQRINSAKIQLEKLLEEFELINHSDNFYLFNQDDENEINKKIKGLGFKIAQGKTISFSKNSFALYDNLNIYKKQIDTKGRLGFKTIYQEELIKNIIDYTLKESPKQAILETVSFFNDLQNKNLEKEKLIYYKPQVLRDYFNYSSYAQRQKRIKAHIKYSLMKDDKFEKALLSDGWHTLDEFTTLPNNKLYSKKNTEFLISEYLGPKNNKSRNLQKGIIGKYLYPIILNEFQDKNKAINDIQNGLNPYNQLELF